MATRRGPEREVTDADIFEAIKSIADPAVASTELSEVLGMTPQALNGRLRDLEKEGILQSKRFGSGKGWWLAQSAPS